MADNLAEIKLERLRRLRELTAEVKRHETGDALKREWADIARPEQLPPDGSWFVWLILAGRGWGKSRTAAEFVAAKARRFPGARLALVARAIGDTRDTMVEGESGLLTVFKASELRGGSIDSGWNRSLGELYLANGSKFFTFSSEKPWRLRGPQFHYCFPAGTVVQTPLGRVSIENVNVGDEVLTRRGPRRVTMTSSRLAELVTVYHETGYLTGTVDHPVMVEGRGWTALGDLHPGDKLFTWVDEFPRARSTSSETRGSKTSTGTGTATSQIPPSSTGTVTYENTVRSGNDIMESWLTGCSSTTSTVTPVTTASRTSKPSPPRNIATFTDESPRSSSVNSAVQTSRRASREHLVNTARPALSNELTTTRAGDSFKQSSVSTAATTSPRAWHHAAAVLAGSAVKAVSTVGLVGRVFNLEVEEEHEFFADDVLVHNCWADEACFWADAHKGTIADTTWSNLTIASRLPRRANWPDDYQTQIVVATTPRPVPLLRVSDPNMVAPGLMQRENVIITRGKTTDNLANLTESYKANVIAPLLGTQLGRQELDAEILEDREGALWKREWFEETRRDEAYFAEHDVSFVRVIIGVDPAVTSGEASDLTGIVVAAADRDGHGYVLGDYTMRGTPMECMKKVSWAFEYHKADRVVGEVNNGGDYIGTVLHTVDPDIPYRKVTASRGKAIRAEPISSLYEQRRFHHVGFFPQLEDELCTWAPSDPESPNRLDALVWAGTDLKDLISGSWLDAYGLIKCTGCQRAFLPTQNGVDRKSCPHCNTPIVLPEAS